MVASFIGGVKFFSTAIAYNLPYRNFFRISFLNHDSFVVTYFIVVDPSVIACRDLLRADCLSATGTADSDLPRICTGRFLRDNTFIFSMAQRRDLFCERFSARVTSISHFPWLSTGGLLRYDAFTVRVPSSRSLFCSDHLTAAGTPVSNLPSFSTGRLLRDHAFIFSMAQSRDFLGLCLAAASTGVGHFARFRACCFPGHYAIVICMDVDFISFFCRAALIGRVPMIGSVPFIIC